MQTVESLLSKIVRVRDGEAVLTTEDLLDLEEHLRCLDAAQHDAANLRAARIACANEFPPAADGHADVSNLHGNIRALKREILELREMVKRG